MEKQVEKVRKPKYAGSFYPAEPKELSKMVEKFVLEGKTSIPENAVLKALIVPHAGYIYSGPVAGAAYSVLKDFAPKRIVLFGPSHQQYFSGAYGFQNPWASPLGEVKIAEHGLQLIEENNEHSLEVQLPFLQTVLKKFEFLPVLYGEIDAIDLASLVESYLDKDTVLVASSDLSHYLPYEKAKRIDFETINSVYLLDLEKFLQIGDACGKTGIGALIVLAKKHHWVPLLLQYKNSGDTAGDKKSVVGYAAIAFFSEKKEKKMNEKQNMVGK
jgi:AmmeMemoRadiSam system protein B